MHAPWERKMFRNLKVAISYALDEAKKHAGLIAIKAGAKEFELVVNHEDKYAKVGVKGVFMESLIEATAVERPEWEREET
jgi:hypothetical protein